MSESRPVELRIEHTISLNKIKWDLVLRILTEKFKMESRSAKRLTDDFLSRCSRPLEPSWFKKTYITPNYNRVAAAICQVYGADVITVEVLKKLRIGFIPIVYRQDIRLIPQFSEVRRDDVFGQCSTAMEVSVFHYGIVIDSLWKAFLLRLSLLVGMVILYALLFGILLYGLAVLVAVVVMPVEGIRAVADSGKMAFALLCFLIGFAGLFGRIVRGVVERIFSGWKRLTSGKAGRD